MARARNIKPAFFRNADLAELSIEARLLFIGLWTLADREGRLEDRPKQIKMEIFPADNLDCESLVQSIADAGMIARYEHGGKRFLQIVNFVKHQNPHRDERPSTIPAQGSDVVQKQEEQIEHGASTVQARCESGASLVLFGLNPESLNPESLTNTPQPPEGADVDPGKQKTKDPELTPGFVKFWETWPTNDRKQARGKCFEVWKKAHAERDAAMVLAHVSRMKNTDEWQRQGGQFVPAPLVYLNQRRWDGAEVEASRVETFV